MPRTLPGLCLLLIGCSAGAGGPGEPRPADIPVLERAVETNPADAEALVRLGVAYGSAGRALDARQALERAVMLEGAPASAWAHLGAWREEAGDLEGAAAAYRTYLETGGRAASDVEARLGRVERDLLARRARDALAREAEIAEEPADPAVVGVLPLAVEGPARYEALGVGLAELLTTDLSLTDRLDVVERAQLAALLEEMKLALAGFTDRAAAARAGRLLRAGRLIQGRIVISEADEGVTVQALVVDSRAPESAGEATQQGALETLMDMEVQLAIEIYRQLGIELTAAERARLEDKPTRNLQAFLAYSEGLQLMDAGDFGGAAARFDAAATLDPGFQAASAAASRAVRIGDAVTPGVLSRNAARELGGFALAGVGGEFSIEQMVDAVVPAGVSATSTGSGSGSGGSQTNSVENTEATAGTGPGQVVRIPIVLVRPRP